MEHLLLACLQRLSNSALVLARYFSVIRTKFAQSDPISQRYCVPICAKIIMSSALIEKYVFLQSDIGSVYLKASILQCYQSWEYVISI